MVVTRQGKCPDDADHGHAAASNPDITSGLTNWTTGRYRKFTEFRQISGLGLVRQLEAPNTLLDTLYRLQVKDCTVNQTGTFQAQPESKPQRRCPPSPDDARPPSFRTQHGKRLA